MSPIPIGRKETETLEFKGRLLIEDDLPALARAVVAMLNQQGGEIWVGVREQDGLASAVEPVDPAHWDRFWNHLVDSVEPPLGEAEVVHEMVPLRERSGAAVLKISIRKPPAELLPFAHVQRNCRHFWIRAGLRVRTMTRDEIAKAFRGTLPTEDSDQVLASQLRRELDRRKDEKRPGFWFAVKPRPSVHLDVSKQKFKEYLMFPDRSGNRDAGWNGMNQYAEPVLKQRRLVQGGKGDLLLEIQPNGSVHLECPFAFLAPRRSSNPMALGPLPLVEYVVSTLRLARHLYRHETAKPPDLVGVHAALFGARGWALQPSLDDYDLHRFFDDPAAFTFDEEEDLTLESPRVFPWSNPEASADEPTFDAHLGACAVNILRPIWWDFRQKNLPPELDKDTGELHFRR